MSLEEKIFSITVEPLAARGYDLVNVSFSGGKHAASLELLIDRFDGTSISINDCVTASQLVSAILDVEDIIQGSYNLNVSSPGEHRPLRNKQDYERFCGNEVTVEVAKTINENEQVKKPKIEGTLVKLDDSCIYIKESTKSSKKCGKPEISTKDMELTKVDFSEIKKATVHRLFKI